MDLRELLFAAVESGDLPKLEELCRMHRTAILDEFPSWQRVPEDMREDQNKLQRYATGLIAVARVFADRLDDDQLIKMLGGGGDNPLAKWDTEVTTPS